MTTSTTNPMVPPVEAVVQGFRKYADFGGRATRDEFWWWVLFIVISSTVLSVIDSLVGLGSSLETLFGLATLLPTLAFTARRLHDIGKTGWWQLGWYAITITAWLTAGIMYVIAAAIEYGTTDASGGWSLDGDNIDWGNSADIFAAFPPSGIVLLAAIVITLGITVWAIFWLVRRGESGQNRFGPDPRTKVMPDSRQLQDS